MAKPTNEQYQAFLARTGAAEKPVPFPYDSTATDLGAINTLRMLANGAAEVPQIASDIYHAPSSVPLLARLMRSVSNPSMSPEVVGDKVAVIESLKGMGDGILRAAMSPGRTLVEHPLSSALNLAAMETATPGGSGLATRLVGEMPGATADAAGLLGRGAVSTAEQALGATTGFSAGEMEAVRDAARTSAVARKNTMDYLRKIKRAPDFAQAVIDAGSKIRDERRTRYVDGVKNMKLKDPSDPIDLQGIRQEFIDLLRSNNITPSIDPATGTVALDFGSQNTVTRGQGRLQKLATDILTTRDDDITSMDALKRRIWSYREGGPQAGNYSNVNRIISEAHDLVRGELGKKVATYDEVEGGYANISKFLEGMLESAGTSGYETGKPEAVVNKLIGALRDPANLDFKKDMISALEEKSGQPIAGMIGALNLRQAQGKQLVSRSLMAGAAIGGLQWLTGAGLDFTYMLPGMLATSPRLAGEFFGALGAGQRAGDKASQFVSDIAKYIPDGVDVQAMSMGDVLEKYVAPKAQQDALKERMTKPAPTQAEALGFDPNKVPLNALLSYIAMHHDAGNVNDLIRVYRERKAKESQ